VEKGLNALRTRRQSMQSTFVVIKVTPTSTLENIFVQLLIFVLVFIQFGGILYSSYSVLVRKIILVLVLVLVQFSFPFSFTNITLPPIRIPFPGTGKRSPASSAESPEYYVQAI